MAQLLRLADLPRAGTASRAGRDQSGGLGRVDSDHGFYPDFFCLNNLSTLSTTNRIGLQTIVVRLVASIPPVKVDGGESS